MKSSTKIAVAVVAALLSTSAAEARTRHHHYRHRTHIARMAAPVAATNCDNNGRCWQTGGIARQVSPLTSQLDAALTEPTAPKGYYYDGRMVGGRHAGDPYAFCGAEAARYVFGQTKRDLWLAANWIRKFPRAQPAAGMAAARNHHVFILMSQVSGSSWLVHDGNAGGHRTWEHVRSIAGYVIVNPHGSRYAMR